MYVLNHGYRTRLRSYRGKCAVCLRLMWDRTASNCAKLENVVCLPLAVASDSVLPFPVLQEDVLYPVSDV